MSFLVGFVDQTLVWPFAQIRMHEMKSFSAELADVIRNILFHIINESTHSVFIYVSLECLRTGMIISCMPAFDIDLHSLFRNDNPTILGRPMYSDTLSSRTTPIPLLYLLWYTCRSGVSVDMIYSIFKKLRHLRTSMPE